MRTGRMAEMQAVEQLAVKRLGAEEGREGQWVIVPTSELRIVFLGSVAIAQRLTFPDLKPAAFLPHRVYVRTGGGVYLTGFRSVAECLDVVAVEGLVLCFESVVINLKFLLWLETHGRHRLGGIRVGVNNGTECVPISRRHLRVLLGRLGMPSRRHRRAGADEMD